MLMAEFRPRDHPWVVFSGVVATAASASVSFLLTALLLVAFSCATVVYWIMRVTRQTAPRTAAAEVREMIPTPESEPDPTSMLSDQKAPYSRQLGQQDRVENDPPSSEPVTAFTNFAYPWKALMAARPLCTLNIPPVKYLSNKAVDAISWPLRIATSEGHTKPMWDTKGRLPPQATACCYLPCVHDGHLYAALTFTYVSNCATLHKVPLNNMSPNAWKEVDLPTDSSNVRWYSRCYLFSYEGYLYFVGRPDVSEASLFSIWRLHTEGEIRGHYSWEQVNVFPELTKGWQDFGIVVHRDRLFICSGKRGWSGERAMMALPLDRAEADWETSWPALPADFFSPSLAVYNGKIQISGSDYHKNVYTLYDDLPPSKRRWVKNDIKPTPHHRCAMACVDGSLVAVGGYESYILWNSYKTHAYVYHELDDSRSEWISLPDLSVPRRRPYLLTFNNKMIVLSGWRRSFVAEVETIGSHQSSSPG